MDESSHETVIRKREFWVNLHKSQTNKWKFMRVKSGIKLKNSLPLESSKIVVDFRNVIMASLLELSQQKLN